MTTTTVFAFASFTQYLQYLRKYALSKRQRPLTLAVMAKRFGYKSPRSMGMVLKGKRPPTARMLETIVSDLKLARDEVRYLKLLAQIERARLRGKPTDDLNQELATLNPQGVQRAEVTDDAFSFIAEWYHIVIKQLVATVGFCNDPAWIRRRLRNKITEAQARAAVQTLLRLGFVSERETPDGVRLVQTDFTTPTGIPSEARRRHHGQMLERAQEALNEQPLDRRLFTSATVRFNTDRLAEARRMLLQFRDRFDREFACDSGSSVFQLNVQLFEHTHECVSTDRGSK